MPSFSKKDPAKIIESDSWAFIPQKHGDSRERSLAFRKEFEEVSRFFLPTANAVQLF